MNVNQTALVNFVWKECLYSNDGKALFNATLIAKKYLGPDCSHDDVIEALSYLPDIITNSFYLSGSDGTDEKILKASINPKYCSEEFRRISRGLAGASEFQPLRPSDQMSDEEVKNFKKNFFGELLETLK